MKTETTMRKISRAKDGEVATESDSMGRKYRTKGKRDMEGHFFVSASFTVEAAAVMPIVLFAIIAMILAGYRAHDIFFTNLIANEALERYGHLPENGIEDADSISAAENDSLRSLFSGSKYTLSLEENGDGAMATVEGEDESRSYEDNGFRPEKILRSVTVIEEIIINE